MLDQRSFHVPVATILVGIPCSGKSTWCRKTRAYDKGYVISRDDIRLNNFGKNYKHFQKGEERVTAIANKQLQDALSRGADIVFDNTHCREKYLDELIKVLDADNSQYVIRIQFFELPLWKAYYRNVLRRLWTGKWIPIKVLKSMKKNYDNINRDKYLFYIW